MPYTDDYTTTQSNTLPGATSGLAVTFDPFTSFGDHGDTLTIRDGASNLIGAYAGEALRRATVNVPASDTVQLTLASIAGNGSGGHSFNLANVAPLGAPGAT